MRVQCPTKRKTQKTQKLLTNTNHINLTNMDIVSRLREFLENEARSGSMDFGCVTPLYVYRMFGGQLSMEDIENGLEELRKLDADNRSKTLKNQALST